MTDVLDRLKTALADRYSIERELGRGGMAIVYLAEDLKHHRPVAIKVLMPTLAAAMGPERFLREIEVTARLNHPHILPLLDSGEADGLLFYVMPFVEGESLRERLDRDKQLSVEDAVQIAAEVADALGFAHDRGVLHRDIKPENILLEGGHAVVADFGLARAITAAAGARLTETGIVVGTPEYMSPEQASGERELSARSDLYSLGCVLYEMLAGEPPFTGPTIASVARQHLTAPPPSVTMLRAAVPEEISQSLVKVLAKAPADRFSSAAEFRNVIAPRGTISPAGIVAVERRATHRRKILGSAVAVAVVVVAVIASVLLFPRGSGGGFDPNRVLVVEFTDESGREEAEALGRWAQDHIIQVLTEAGFAKVVDQPTVLAVSQNVAAAGVGAGDILALADDAGAGTVVSGSIYAEGDSLYVQTRITDANDGSSVGTVQPVVGSIGARSGLVARLGQEVAAALATLLDRDLGAWEPASRPTTYEAYVAYSDGLQAYLQNEMAEAAHQFARAVEADSTFARARLWAAQSYFLIAWGPDGWSHKTKAESLIAPLVESRGQLSRYLRCRLDFVIALGRYSSSLGYEAARCMAEVAPGSDDAKREVALFAWYRNRPGEAVELLRGLDPERGLMKQWGGYWDYLSRAYQMLGDYGAALEVARKGLQRLPGSPRMLLAEARALAALGRLDDLAPVVETMRSLPSREFWGRFLPTEVAEELRAHGHRDAARGLIDESIAWFRSRPLDTDESRAELAELLYQAERWGDAQRLYEELAAEYPETTASRRCCTAAPYLAALGKLAARRGDREEALRISERLASLRYPSRETLFHTLERARIAALLGDRVEATTLIQAFDKESWYRSWWQHDIDFESLHDYPPFQELLRPKG